MHGFRERHDARRQQHAAAGAEQLEIDMAMAAIDRGGDRRRRIGGDIGRRQRRKRRDADHGLAGGERNAARGGDADPQSGEAAGADRHRNAVERGKGNRRLLASPPRAAASALRHGRAP